MRNFGYEDKTRYALVHVGPLTASGRNEIIARTQYRSTLIWGVVKWIGIRLKRDGYEIHDLHKPHPPKKGEPGYVLTMDERFEFERKWDAMIAANKK